MTRQQNKNTIIETQNNMTTTELSNPTIAGPERFSITEAQDNNLNIEIITCSRTLNRLRINPLMTLERWKQMGK